MSQRSKERRVGMEPTDRSAGPSTDRSVRTDRRPSPCTATADGRHRSLSADAAENLRRVKLGKKRVTLEAGILAAELSAAEAWIHDGRQDRQALLAELREVRAVMRADADAARAELRAAVAWTEQENADELAHYRSTNAALRGRLAELATEHAASAERAAREQAWGREAEAEEAERELRLARTRQESFDKQQTSALRRMTNQAATLKQERTEAQRGREAAEVTAAVAEQRAREAEALSRRQAEAIGEQQKQLESLRPKLGELGLQREQLEAELEGARNRAQLLELKLATYIEAHGLLPLVPGPEAPKPKRASVHASPRAAPAAPAAPARPAATVVGEDGRSVVAEWRSVVGDDGTLHAQLQTINEEHARQQAAQAAQLETVQRITAERDSYAATSREQLHTIKGLKAEVRERRSGRAVAGLPAVVAQRQRQRVRSWCSSRAHCCMCTACAPPCAPHVHVRMCACAHVRMCACAHVRMCACAHVRMCACAHVPLHLHVQVRQRERDLQNRDQREREVELTTPLQQQAMVKAQASRSMVGR